MKSSILDTITVIPIILIKKIGGRDMKAVRLILLLLIIYQQLESNDIQNNFVPGNTVLAFDMDNTVIKPYFDWKAYFLYLVFVKNPLPLWRLTTNQYISSIFERLNKRRLMIPDVLNLLLKLKSMGYTLVVATNGNQSGFEYIMNYLNFDTLYYGKPLFDLIVTTEDIIDDAIDKNFLQKSPSLGSSYIKTTPHFKPSIDYFKSLRLFIDDYAQSSPNLQSKTPHIIFFDDIKDNVEGAQNSNVDITAFIVPKYYKGEGMKKNLTSCGIAVKEGVNTKFSEPKPYF